MTPDQELRIAQQAEFDLMGGFPGLLRNEVARRLFPLLGTVQVNAYDAVHSALARLLQDWLGGMGALPYGYVREMNLHRIPNGYYMDACFYPRFCGKEEWVSAEVHLYNGNVTVKTKGLADWIMGADWTTY